MVDKNKDYLTPVDMERQEHLSLSRLKALTPSCSPASLITARPPANFIDLMNWTKDNFANGVLKEPVLKLVHNRIIIDGQFLEFCEENSVKIECLWKDSIISWKSENNYEKFFVQGIFHITSKNVNFIHAALFHKGNQNEDEISFFVLVSEKDYENYIVFRNKFDEWVQQRDRSNLNIHVVDGDDIPYTKDVTWDQMFLPDDIKNDLKSLVENFLASKDFYLEKKIPWKRGVLLYGKPGNGKTSIIRTIISEYNFKPVTIEPGADDNSVREAFSYAEEQSPSLLYFEDLDSLFERGVDKSTFLNLMDGISTKNGLLVIATANEVKKLTANITQRPSRFDRKFEIPLPNQKMAYIYLKRWFGNLIDNKKCKELAKYAEMYEFSYAYLKELYISSMFEALAHNRKAPTLKDIDNALNRLVKDKNILNSGNAINTDKYFNKG
jgi:AAA+ superfamily predicted ATPase